MSFPEPQEAESAPFSGGYVAAQAAKLLDLSPNQIREFVRAGFLTPRKGPRGEERFTFQDLVLLRTAKELSARLSPRKVKRALRELKSQLPRGRELSALRITAEGDDVVVREGKAAWNPESGQTLINFEVAELAAEVAPLAREAAQAAIGGERQLGFEDWYELGCDLETHDPDQARDAYRRALEMDPRHPDAHLNLGRLLHESGHLEAAKEHYKVALESRPGDAVAAFNLGVSFQDMKKIPEAIKAYNRAISLDPGSADAHFNLAQLYEETGKNRMALRHWSLYRRITGYVE